MDAHYIIDNTKTFSFEGFLLDYYSEKFLGVNHSSNYFIDGKSPPNILFNNYM